jgi:diacylglycerol kinase family enzyme
MIKKIYVIANPASGIAEDALGKITRALDRHGLSYRLDTAKTPPEAYELAKNVDPTQYDALAVYGGDGTVIAVYKAVYDKRLPVIILPGGTANVLARELRLTNIDAIIKMVAEDHYIIRYHDIALANNQPLVLNLHFGGWAEALKSTPATVKRLLGKLAYYISALKMAVEVEAEPYRLTIDNHDIAEDAYTVIIANAGYQNVAGVSLWPKAHGRGQLQVAIVKSKRITDLWRWYIRRLVGAGDQKVIATYQAQSVVVHQAPPEMIFDDDHMTTRLPLAIMPSPAAVMAIAPARAAGGPLRTTWQKLLLAGFRAGDHLARIFTGRAGGRFSHVGPGLYLGGQLGPTGFQELIDWGVTGIISMRTSQPLAVPKGLKLLHLPTTDWEPPSLEALQQGVKFINEQIKSGGAVYVHCRLGEGRGPGMAAAYLISRGMRTVDAIGHLQRYRPFARPNARQIRQLARFEEDCRKQQNPE